MKVLITGAGGMLGHALVDAFSRDDVVAWDRNDLEITDRKAVLRRIAEARPGIVVNAAAYTAVDQAEDEEAAASRVNGDAVGYLAEACAVNGAVFVQYSTDYVFDGLNSQGYDEDAVTQNPVNAYGRSKLAGEQQLLGSRSGPLRFYLIRTSWLYGPHGKNFVDTMLQLGKAKDELKVVNDQFGKPTYTVDLASATKEIVEHRMPTGIYHVTNETPGGGITWYDFAVEIFKQAGMSVRVTPCTSADFPRPAKRPTYSMLVNTKTPARRGWREALSEYVASGSAGRGSF